MPILSNYPGGAGSGSGGVTLGAVSNINVLVASGKVYVKWTDPSDIVVTPCLNGVGSSRRSVTLLRASRKQTGNGSRKNSRNTKITVFRQIKLL